MLRSRLSLVLLAAIALVPSCRPKAEGSPRVLVIGAKPQVRDPAIGPLSPGDAVLVQNVAQGLVQFDPGGNIVGGLAERWNVSNDGLSYIFRLASADWPTGGKITAKQVAKILKRTIAAPANPLKDTVAAVQDVVAMTDRVIEIRLKAPRPNLLTLLAQPEFAIIRAGAGTGPFKLDEKVAPGGSVRLFREVAEPDAEAERLDEVRLGWAPAEDAIRQFAAGRSDLVLGGTFADLPFAQRTKLPRNSLRFDPAAGLFGLKPVRSDGPLADPDFRRLLSESIDRDALVDALNVPGLGPRTTMLEPGLEGLAPPPAPAWAATPLDERRPGLVARAKASPGAGSSPTVRILLPKGPGADLLLNRLAQDWSAIGITAERADTLAKADLVLVDAVAPSASPAWYLRQFHCGLAPECSPDADKLVDAARDTLVPAQRSALFSEAASLMDQAQLFIPLAAPIRWSLVSGRMQGFAGNRFARHTLTDLDQRPSPGGS